jgi:hypothetical protein
MRKQSSLNELIAQAAAAEDQTDTTSGGFDFELPPAGVTVGRLVEYIELGVQPQKDYAGKPKPPVDQVRLTVEFLAPKNRHEFKDSEGSDRVRYDRMSINMTKKLNDRAKYTKLFNKMRAGRDDVIHMAQMIDVPLRFEIFHNEGKNKKGEVTTYANLWDKDGGMNIGVPKFQPDPLSDVWQDIPVPEAVSPLKVFFYNNPTNETWDSLFINGVREVKNGDQVEEVSKNWIQELIVSAVNYSGSRMEAFIEGVTEEETPLTEEEANEANEANEVEEVVAPPKKVAKAPAAKPAAKVNTKPAATVSKAVTTASKGVEPKAAAKGAVKPKPTTAGQDQLKAMGLI